MKTVDPVLLSLVEVTEAASARRFWLVGRRLARVPDPIPRTLLLAEYLGAAGRTRFEDVTARAGQETEAGALLRFLRVMLQPRGFQLIFPALGRDAAERAWDLTLRGTLRVLDAPLFVETCAGPMVSVGSPLLIPMLEAWMVGQVRDQVRREVAEVLQTYTLDQARDKEARPPGFWNESLAGRFKAHGIAVVFDQVCWESAEAARQEADRLRLAALEAQRKQEALEREAALREQALLGTFEGKRRQIEADFQRQEQELDAAVAEDQAARQHALDCAREHRDQQLRLLQEEGRQQLLETEAVTQKARQALELAAQQHLAELSRLGEVKTRAREAAVEAARRREHEVALQQQELEAERERKRLALLHDQELTQAAREGQLESFGAEQDLAAENARQAADSARQARERAEAEHLLALERIETERQAVTSARLAAAQAQEHRAREAEMLACAEWDAFERNLAMDQALAESDRQGRLELAEADYQRRRQAAQNALDAARQAAERAALDHQQALIEARQRIVAVQQQHAQEAQKRAAEAQRHTEEVRRQQVESAARYEALKKQLAHDDRLSEEQRKEQLGLLQIEQGRRLLAAQEAATRERREAELAAERHRDAFAEMLRRRKEAEEFSLEQQRLHETRARFNVERLVKEQEDELARLQERLAHNQTLSELDRRHEVEERQRHQEKARALAQKELEDIRRSNEQAEAEHQARLRRLLQEDAEAGPAREEARLQGEAARAEYQRLQEQLEAARAFLGRAERDAEIRNLLVLLNEPDPFEAHQAAESLMRLGVRPESLASLGYQVSPQQLLARLKEKQQRDGLPVVLRNHHLTTRSLDRLLASSRRLQEDQPEAQAILGRMISRDVSTRPKLETQVEHLEMNQSLQFEFTTSRVGYVTVLNLGTSGKVWLHVPNFHVAPDWARLHAPGKRSVPGPELLPRELIPAYYEGGPRGDEHMVVILSDQPLAEAAWVRRSSPGNPLVHLSEGELAMLGSRLAALPPASWTAGVLSFVVV